MQEKVCNWFLDDDGFWEADCGLAWVLTDGGSPSEHQMQFCPQCGNKLVEHVEDSYVID